jgi:hypothetical protein
MITPAKFTQGMATLVVAALAAFMLVGLLDAQTLTDVIRYAALLLASLIAFNTLTRPDPHQPNRVDAEPRPAGDDR